MKKVDTFCRNCIFAIYDGITQTGCHFDRIRKFSEQGISVIEACNDPENPPSDGYKEYYVLENTICNTCRTNGIKNVHPDKNIDELKQIIRDQVKIVYNWILVNKHENENQLKERLAEIKGQPIKPQRVCLIRYESSPLHPRVSASLLTKKFKYWAIEDLVSDSTTVDQGIDILLSKYKIPFYVLSSVEEKIEDNIVEKIDSIINDELLRFAILKIGNINIVPTSVHISLQGGMFGTTLMQKIEEICPDKILIL